MALYPVLSANRDVHDGKTVSLALGFVSLAIVARLRGDFGEMGGWWVGGESIRVWHSPKLRDRERAGSFVWYGKQ